MKIVALIPARAGSKRIIHKNLQQLDGIPLLGIAVKQAKEVDLIDEVYISTDDEIFAKVAENYGAGVPYIRPKYLADDNSTDYDVFLHFLNWYKEKYNEYPDLIVQVRPTAPIRNSEVIKDAIITIMNDKNADSLRTVSIPHQTPYKMWKKEDGTNYLSPVLKIDNNEFDGPTQALPQAFAQDGVVDIIRSRTILKKHNMAGNKIIGYTKHKFTWDIDNPEDLEFVKGIYSIDYKLNNKPETLGTNLGIIQGRLTKSKELQQFPNENWEDEFSLARECGYSHIELIRDIEYNEKNPLWNEKIDLEKVNKQAIKDGVATRIICDDYIQMCNWEKLTADQYLNIIDILYKARKVNAKMVVFPLFKEAELNNEIKRQKFIFFINKIAKIAEVLKIRIALEITEEHNELRKLMENIKSNNVGICYDTGNIIAEGINPIDYLNDDEVFKRIIHVHLKDRNENNDNVVIGTGLVKFNEIIKMLLSKKYNGCLTTETSRGEDPIRTAIETKKYLQKLF